MTTLEIATLAIAIIGAITGITGAVLGIINARYTRLKDQERVEVLLHLYKTNPHWVLDSESPEGLWVGVELINHSSFPVLIKAVTLEILIDTGMRPRDYARVLYDLYQYARELPVKIEPHASQIFHYPQDLNQEKDYSYLLRYSLSAKAMTATEKVFTLARPQKILVKDFSTPRS